MLYVANVTDEWGLTHRVEVTGDDPICAMKDAIKLIPRAKRVSLPRPARPINLERRIVYSNIPLSGFVDL